jgi:hypothetical protein
VRAIIPLCWLWDDPDSELCQAWDELAAAAGADGHTGDSDAEVAHGTHPDQLWWLHERRDRWMHVERVRG